MRWSGPSARSQCGNLSALCFICLLYLEAPITANASHQWLQLLGYVVAITYHEKSPPRFSTDCDVRCEPHGHLFHRYVGIVLPHATLRDAVCGVCDFVGRAQPLATMMIKNITRMRYFA